jgi:ribonuclease BN (tRNA processing enzyme)
MEIRLWGTRGSIPSPGPLTLEYGGNTCCVEVKLASGHRVVIDGGTGIRLLGEEIKRSGGPLSLHLLLTHNHWDHLLGLPFFAPIYWNDTEILVDGWPQAFQALTRIFDDNMGNGFFPVAFDELQARITFINRVARGPLHLEGVTIDSIPLNHPQGGLGFRFRDSQATMVFITDNELGEDGGHRFQDFVNFARGCDLLIHDAQYLPEELAEHREWGHSTYEEVVRLALAAEVKSLLLTHHDPARSDAQVGEIIERARKLAAARGNHPPTIDGAREGAVYRLPGG